MEFKEEKIYKVTFLEYSNYAHTNIKTDVPGVYIDISNPCLMRESDIEIFKNYGGGFDSVEFVGYLHDFENTK